MPDTQLRIFGKENFGNKNFVGREIARRDCFIVFGVLLRVDQDRRRFFRNGVIVGPFSKDLLSGVHQINLDPLVCRKLEGNGTLGLIRQCQFNLELADFRELYSLRRDLQIECEAAQSRIFVLRNQLGRKWVERASAASR